MKPIYSRLFYTGFVVLALYFLVFKKDYMMATTQLGIGLIFDPFDQNQTWAKRPLWQRAWMIIHLMIVIGLFIYGLIIER